MKHFFLAIRLIYICILKTNRSTRCSRN